MKTTKTTSKSLTGEVRIIGGNFRSRKLQFPALVGLRPTPNRVRETLFNWLADKIRGANCLDLFAGSGALGFEALSRGACSVLMVDQSPQAVTALRDNAALLQVTNQVTIFLSTVPNDKIFSNAPPFDIVFLDPPFHQQLLEPCCQWLEASGYLAEETLIYMEAELELPLLFIPTNWQLMRSKKAGQVSYYLLQRLSRS